MAKQRKATGPKLLGTIESSSLLVGETDVVARWTGLGTGNADDSDCERARHALAKRDAAMIDIGTQLALAVALGVGPGRALIYQLADQVTVVDATADPADPAFVAWLVSPAEKKTRSAAMLATPSKKLTIVSIAEPGTTGISLPVAIKVAIAVEPPATGAWGSGRRMFVRAHAG